VRFRRGLQADLDAADTRRSAFLDAALPARAAGLSLQRIIHGVGLEAQSGPWVTFHSVLACGTHQYRAEFAGVSRRNAGGGAI